MLRLDLFEVVQNLFFYPHHLKGYVEDEWDYYLVKIFASTNSLHQQGYQCSSGVQGGLDFGSPLKEMSAETRRDRVVREHRYGEALSLCYGSKGPCR